MKNLLTKLDFFGVKTEFNSFGNLKYKSFLGFIFSLICLVMIIVTTILFGRDFYLKEIPRIVTETIKTSNYSFINVQPSNFTIAFTLTKNDMIPCVSCFKDDFFFNIWYVNQRINSTTGVVTGDWMVQKQVPCNESLAPDPLFTYGKNLSEFVCFNFPKDGFLFGGSQSSKNVNFFSVNISNKNLQTNYIANLTSIKERRFGTASVYFSIYYPDFYFVPNDIDNPMNIRYTNYITYLSPKLTRLDRFFFKTYYLEDDQGWIFKNQISYSRLAFDSMVTDYYSKDMYTEFDNYAFYSYVIYYNSDYVRYFRSYMKVQELAALVGGFMKIIFFIIQLLLFPYNEYLLKSSLVNQFTLKKIEKNDQLIITNNYVLNENQKNPILRNPSISNTNKPNFSNLNLKNNEKSEINDKHDIGFYQYYKNKILCGNKPEHCKDFYFIEDTIDQALDITSYLKFYNNKDILSLLLFDDEQQKVIKVLSSNYLFQKESTEENEMQKDEIFNYFTAKKVQSISEIDKRLLSLIPFK